MTFEIDLGLFLLVHDVDVQYVCIRLIYMYTAILGMPAAVPRADWHCAAALNPAMNAAGTRFREFVDCVLYRDAALTVVLTRDTDLALRV